MTEDNRPTVSSSDSISQTDSCTTKQRKKRKWDVPAEPLVAAGLALPGNLPLVNGESLVGITLPGMVPVSNGPVATHLVANGTALVPGFQAPLLQHAVALAQKLNPPKIQDELIAREIVINDADSAIRYKLTKRQTQEEIQKSTGAVVITRGKYRPPNAPADGEKPLYLHISAGSHLETTVERIKAVDLAAAMVEEMLKEGSVNNGLKVNHLLSTCVYLGFEADPSLNVYARIRGPNDQYINHIMNETGATVLLRGRGSGVEGAKDEEGQQPLHLFLSSYNPKSLEQAKLLAENLLDTISADFGASRISSSKVYGAVPPPPQLLTGVQCSVNESKASNVLAVSSTVSSMESTPAVSAVTSPGLTGVVPQGIVSQSAGGLILVQSQPTTSCYPHSPLSSGTSYNGYAGIYPQATPLQQVALALRQSASPVTATIAPVTTAADTATHTNVGSSSVIDRRPPQKRKFQELPAAGKGLTSSQQKSLQGSNLQKPHELTSDAGARHVSMMPPAKNFVQLSSNGVMMPTPKDLVCSSSNGMPPPPPPKNMPPPPPPPKNMPPPPPKFKSPSPRAHENNNMPSKMQSESVPDTLVKLMEYGDDDDDDESEETREESLERNSTAPVAPKPFWAV